MIVSPYQLCLLRWALARLWTIPGAMVAAALPGGRFIHMWALTGPKPPV